PRKSPATRLTQRQAQRRDKLWLFDRLLFFTDPDFENFVVLARMLNPFSASSCSFVNFASRFHTECCAHGRATRFSDLSGAQANVDSSRVAWLECASACTLITSRIRAAPSSATAG